MPGLFTEQQSGDEEYEVPIHEWETCEKSLLEKDRRDMKHHPHTVHPEVHAALLEKEEAGKKAKTLKESVKLTSSLKATCQKTLFDSFKRGSKRQVEIAIKSLRYLLVPHVSYRIVDNFEFHNVLTTRTLLLRRYKKILKAKISTEANKVSMCGPKLSRIYENFLLSYSVSYGSSEPPHQADANLQP